MKNLSQLSKTFIITLCLVCSYDICHAQWNKTYSTGYDYYSLVSGEFTWSGNSVNNYVDGFGTIQWYDASNNPSFRYVGNVQRGRNQGYGTLYYANGDIYYRGDWENGGIKDFQSFKSFANVLGSLIEDKVFDGGTNLQTTITELVSTGDDNNEMKIRIEFNGNIVTTNYYAFTLVINKEAPYVHFEDINDAAGWYMLYKSAEIIKLVNDAINNNNQN